MPPQSNSCFTYYITFIFNCKGFFINIFWICVYVRFFGLVLLLNLRYQLDVCVGANTVRPSKKQTHGNNKVRQQKILPDNSEFTANPEHGRTLFARRRNKPTVTTFWYRNKIIPPHPYNSEFTANPEHGRTLFAPTDYSGEFVMPQNRYARCRGHNFGQLCSFLIPHSSLLT